MDDVLTPRERDRLIEAARGRRHRTGKLYRHSVRDALILRLLLECGLRSSEVVGLQLEGVQRGAEHILVDGRHRRFVPCDAELSVSVQDWIESTAEERSLWMSPTVFNVSTDGVERIVETYAARARIVRRVRPTTLRRTYAQTVVVARGWTLEQLARALGVASTATAARYLGNDIVGGGAVAAVSGE